ncbi:MAG: MFS transporter [Mycobacterium sp.]|nr:MFS transporter [Mycobacterium sp.]
MSGPGEPRQEPSVTSSPRQPPTGCVGKHLGIAHNPIDEYAARPPRLGSRPNDTDQDPSPLDERRAAAPERKGYLSSLDSKVARLYFRAVGTPDGADKSGLIQVTYPTMANTAVDAATTVALANTVFFAGASVDDEGGAALYLLLTVVPFALIAPIIGPVLDRLQHGRRFAMAVSFALRLPLIIMLYVGYDAATNSYRAWALYPSALGIIVLSKSFSVLRSTLIPRVMPPTSNLVRLNSHMKVVGLIGGTLLGGGVAAGTEIGFKTAVQTTSGLSAKDLHLPLALSVGIIAAVWGAYLCMRTPRWIEVTAGEVPTRLSYHHSNKRSNAFRLRQPLSRSALDSSKPRQPLSREILTSWWGNVTIKVMAGFLFLYPVFVAKAQQDVGSRHLGMLGIIGGAATVGTFVGSAATDRFAFSRPAKLVARCTTVVTAAAATTALIGTFYAIAVAALVTSVCSALAKASLDSSLQDGLPDESRASAFGQCESLLQVGWVAGGAAGVLSYTNIRVGFLIISAFLALGLVIAMLIYRGRPLVAGSGGRRSLLPEQESGGTPRTVGSPASRSCSSQSAPSSSENLTAAQPNNWFGSQRRKGRREKC